MLFVGNPISALPFWGISSAEYFLSLRFLFTQRKKQKRETGLCYPSGVPFTLPSQKRKNHKTDLFSPSGDLCRWIFFIVSNFRVRSKKRRKRKTDLQHPSRNVPRWIFFIVFVFRWPPADRDRTTKIYKTDLYSHTHTRPHPVSSTRKPCENREIRFHREGRDSPLRCFRITSSVCTRQFPIISRIHPSILSQLPGKTAKGYFYLPFDVCVKVIWSECVLSCGPNALVQASERFSYSLLLSGCACVSFGGVIFTFWMGFWASARRSWPCCAHVFVVIRNLFLQTKGALIRLDMVAKHACFFATGREEKGLDINMYKNISGI